MVDPSVPFLKDKPGHLDYSKLGGLRKATQSYKGGAFLEMKNMGNGWVKREYADLTEQWFTLQGSQQDLYLELMETCSPGYRVVRRKGKGMVKEKCPPPVSGPHNTLEAGKAAYLVALATL